MAISTCPPATYSLPLAFPLKPAVRFLPNTWEMFGASLQSTWYTGVYEFYQLDPSTEVRSQVKYIFSLHRGPLILQPCPIQRTCSEVEFGWGRAFSSGRQGRCQRPLLASCTYGPLVTATHLGRRGTKQKLPHKAVLMAGGDGRPRTEHQNHGHRTCSCCSRLAFPKPCLTPTQAQTEVKEPLRKSAFSNSRNPIRSWLCRDLGRPRESNTHHWQEQPFTQDGRAGCPPQFEKTRRR